MALGSISLRRLTAGEADGLARSQQIGFVFAIAGTAMIAAGA